MGRERHKIVFELFNKVVDRPDSEREAFLRRESGGDDSLVEEVLRLLTHDPGSVKSEPKDTAPNLVDTMIDEYRLVKILGSGGMGEVYLAEQERPIRRQVALKVIKLGMDTKEVIARFKSERQALAMMDHVNIAKIHSAGTTQEGRPYFVMEYVKGIAITNFCNRHRLSTKERLRLFIHVCWAVHHAHQKGIIHRDLKPSNVLVVNQDENWIPKVIDFGIATATNSYDTIGTMFTEQGQLIGTPEYMSPEQAEISGRNVDTTTDVYTLGVLLYELLTDLLPFEPGTLRAAGYDEIRRIIREVEPAKPSSRLSTRGDRATTIANNRKSSASALFKHIRGELDWITMRALEKERSRRYQSASGLALDIERFLRDEPVVAGPPSTTYRASKLIKKHKRAVGSFLAVVAALAIGLGVSTTMFFRAENAREEAEIETQKAESINTFLQDMLGSVNPAHKGKEVTVRQALDEAASQVDTDLAAQPQIQAAVRSTIGLTYVALGLYDSADLHLTAALATRQKVFGDDHPEVAAGIYNLASLRNIQGKYTEAESLYLEAVDIRKRLFGPEHVAVAAALGGLGSVYSSQGRYAEAEPILKQTLTMQRKLLGDGHADVAEGLNSLALLLQEEGNYAEAEAMFREALTIRRELFGEEHPATAVSIGNLGLVLRLQGDYAAAEGFYRKAISIDRKLHGDEHKELAAKLHNLSTILKIQGQYAEAEVLSREALDTVNKCFGEDHLNASYCLTTLAGILAYREKYDEAESLYLKAIDIRKGSFGEEHSTIALSMNELAGLLQTRGRYREAESWYRKALAMQEKILGGNHPDIARSLHNLASLLVERGEDGEAEAILRRCLGIRKEKLPPGHSLTASGSMLLGDILVRKGQFEEAETHLVPSCSILGTSTVLTLERKRNAFRSVIALYEAWGKPGEMAQWRERMAVVE